MSHGVIGKWLREFEQGSKNQRRAPHPGQVDMFAMLGIDALAAPEKCKSLAKKLDSQPLRDLDEKRYEACLRIQQQKDRVVFLAERMDTLEIFAEALSQASNR